MVSHLVTLMWIEVRGQLQENISEIIPETFPAQRKQSFKLNTTPRQTFCLVPGGVSHRMPSMRTQVEVGVSCPKPPTLSATALSTMT